MSNTFFQPKNIVAVDVYLEYRKTRKFAGKLTENSKSGKSEFHFVYDKKYVQTDSAIPLGPDIPLTQIAHTSQKLFNSFLDRIPSKQNPAYGDYCAQMGIDKEEKNPIILLATIGHKGPSSFIFEPCYRQIIDMTELRDYRKKLGLTFREFANVFEFSTRTLQNLEAAHPVSKDTIKRLEIYMLFPDIALYQVMKNGAFLISEKKYQLVKHLKENKIKQ